MNQDNQRPIPYRNCTPFGYFSYFKISQKVLRQSPRLSHLPLDDLAIFSYGKSRFRAIHTISHFCGLLYPFDFLKQSIHFRLVVSLGANGRDVIAPPQVLHFQSPENLGFSPPCDGVLVLAPPPLFLL